MLKHPNLAAKHFRTLNHLPSLVEDHKEQAFSAQTHREALENIRCYTALEVELFGLKLPNMK